MYNARYQRGSLVAEKVLKPKIQIVFLPLYSPNLNVIERLWNFVKKKVLNNQYYSKYVLSAQRRRVIPTYNHFAILFSLVLV
jgi:transposase